MGKKIKEPLEPTGDVRKGNGGIRGFGVTLQEARSLLKWDQGEMKNKWATKRPACRKERSETKTQLVRLKIEY